MDTTYRYGIGVTDNPYIHWDALDVFQWLVENCLPDNFACKFLDREIDGSKLLNSVDMYLLKEDFRIPQHHVDQILKKIELLKNFQSPDYDSWDSGGGDLSPEKGDSIGGHVLPKEGWSGYDDAFQNDMNTIHRSDSPEVIDFNSFYEEVTSPPPNEHDVANDLIDKEDFKADDAWEHEPNEPLELEMPEVRRPSVPQNNAEEDLADFSDEISNEELRGIDDLFIVKANQIALQMYEEDIVGRGRENDDALAAGNLDFMEGWNAEDELLARQHVNGVHSDNDPQYVRELFENYQHRWEEVVVEADGGAGARDHPFQVLSLLHQRQNLQGVDNVNLDVDNMTMEELMELQERMGGDVKIGVSNLERFPSLQIASKTDIERFDHRCAICIVDYQLGDKVRLLPCKHSYHTKCIDAWSDQHSKCPICKMDFNCIPCEPKTKDEIAAPKITEIV